MIASALRRASILAIVMFSWATPPAHAADTMAAAHALDDFADLAAWQPVASDGVKASLGAATGPHGPALRLDFDLAGTAGYAIARRALPVDVPENYEISFYVRADAPVNDLQFKLIDASGDNVWWMSRRNFEFPSEWQRIRIKKRQIEFAWGPTRDRTLRHVATVEFVVAAGRGGGKGSVYVSQLELRPLPPEPAVYPPLSASASSALARAAPASAIDGNIATAWQSDPAAGAEQTFVVDFGRPREFGGLILRWMKGAYASRYDVQFSDDGVRWETVRSITGGTGGPDALALPEAEARYLRLALHEGPARSYGLAELEIKELAFGASPNAFFEAVARDSPRGYFPRGFSGEQPCWTLVGVDGGSETGLLSEDGALEVARGGFTIEPFIVTDAKVVTWADVDAHAFLVDDYLPMPGVAWRHAGWEMRVTTFAAGTRAASQLIARYDVRNRTRRPMTLTLVLAMRPFQVNPPSQFLNAPGGVSAVHEIGWDGNAMSVNGARRVFALAPPDRAGAFPFDAGPTPKLLAALAGAGAREIRDPTGYASAMLAYRMTLAPNVSRTVGVVVPLSGAATRPMLAGLSPSQWLTREQGAVAATWRAKLDRVVPVALAHGALAEEGAE